MEDEPSTTETDDNEDDPIVKEVSPCCIRKITR